MTHFTKISVVQLKTRGGARNFPTEADSSDEGGGVSTGVDPGGRRVWPPNGNISYS